MNKIYVIQVLSVNRPDAEEIRRKYHIYPGLYCFLHMPSAEDCTGFFRLPSLECCKNVCSASIFESKYLAQKAIKERGWGGVTYDIIEYQLNGSV
jgi:hypothetical protein